MPATSPPGAATGGVALVCRDRVRGEALSPVRETRGLAVEEAAAKSGLVLGSWSLPAAALWLFTCSRGEKGWGKEWGRGVGGEKRVVEAAGGTQQAVGRQKGENTGRSRECRLVTQLGTYQGVHVD